MTQKKLVTLLAIAGSDSTGGAGIQADIKAAAACGVYTATAVTAVTAQNSSGVSAIISVSPEILEAQLLAIAADVTPDAVKIGMIGSAENGAVIADFLKSLPSSTPVVIDPVLASSAGGDLADDKRKLADVMLSSLFPFSSVVTPNLNEALYFLGETESVISHDSIDKIAERLLSLFGCESVILKGGHLQGDLLVDTLVSNQFQKNPKKYFSRRIECKNLHGTGCSYASVLASELAKGVPIENAFVKTSSFINETISRSTGYSFGNSAYGPLNILDYTLK